jgi:hypothetical protein
VGGGWATVGNRCGWGRRVLNYLRHEGPAASLQLPDGPVERAQLACEAEYFMLDGLLHLLRPGVPSRLEVEVEVQAETEVWEGVGAIVGRLSHEDFMRMLNGLSGSPLIMPCTDLRAVSLHYVSALGSCNLRGCDLSGVNAAGPPGPRHRRAARRSWPARRSVTRGGAWQRRIWRRVTCAAATSAAPTCAGPTSMVLTSVVPPPKLSRAAPYPVAPWCAGRRARACGGQGQS